MIVQKLYHSIFMMLVGILSIVCFFSCQDKERERFSNLVHDWQGKEILFPDSLVFARFGTDTVDNILSPDAPYKILVYIDSLGCTTCKLQLDRWKEFIAYVDSATNDRIPFCFILPANRKKALSRILKSSKFEYPVCFDDEGRMDKLNQFPHEIKFQTLLLNKNNRVEVIGSPVYNLGVRDLYLEYLLKIPRQEMAAITELRPDRWEYDLGVVHKGTVREQLVSVQNIGTHSFHLKGITTSCDCTKAVCDWKELLPGETGIVTVAYTAEQPGDFFRTVEIFGNIGPESVELSFIGTVK
ncbi:hypothetical protein B5F34_11245 [Mediterranea sp. An20]|uniref:DUF1573 domain-containing protein n=1 Tax=Mediterranea sp. An20 TaxID=1965586 RepID=UPI000B562097|nr:DUF1573 domain-containing protein [Mediterranea sp. An20]OUP07526.1 hypothetical protein B5F34_11245 [Mediterranea sp. An20]